MRETYKANSSRDLLVYHDVGCPYFLRAALKGKAHGMDMVVLSELADNGNTRAMEQLAYDNGRGFGVDKNLSKAVRRYKKISSLGDVLAMRKLARLYRMGREVPQDYSQAMQYFQMAVISNDADSMWYLGVIYNKGLGTFKDHNVAMRWWLEAAQNGSEDAIRKFRELE